MFRPQNRMPRVCKPFQGDSLNAPQSKQLLDAHIPLNDTFSILTLSQYSQSICVTHMFYAPTAHSFLK